MCEAYMAKPNLLERAINCDDGDYAARMIRDALGIESDDVTNYRKHDQPIASSAPASSISRMTTMSGS